MKLFKLLLFRFILFTFGSGLFMGSSLIFRCGDNTTDNTYRVLVISLGMVSFALFRIRELTGGFPILDKRYSQVDKYLLLVILGIGLLQIFTVAPTCN